MTYSEETKTLAVQSCTNFTELYSIIKAFEPFISNSRATPVEWKADALIIRIFMFLDGGEPNLITRANGLRDKVIELKNRMIDLNKQF